MERNDFDNWFLPAVVTIVLVVGIVVGYCDYNGNQLAKEAVSKGLVQCLARNNTYYWTTPGECPE